MSRDYITDKVRIPEGPESGIAVDQLQMQENQHFTWGDNEEIIFGDANIVASPQVQMYFDHTKNYLVLTKAGGVINEAVVGVTMPGRALSIEYSPVFDSALATIAASALVVQMTPTANGATGANRVNALYVRLTTSAACKAVQGTGTAGEFEVVHPASVIVQSAYSVLRLVDRNDGVTVSANRAFITLRDYSTAAYRNPNFVNFWSFPALDLSGTKIMSLAGAIAGDLPYNAAIRCVYGAGNTPIWLMASTTDPSGVLDFKRMGSVLGNYLEWDASADKLSVLVAARTVNGEEEALDIAFTGTLSEDADHILGFNVAVVPAGVHGGWVSGGFIKVSMPGAGRPVDGYVSGLEIEVNHTAGVGVQCAYYVLNLNDNNGGVTASANRAFICLNDYGVAAYQMPHLFKFATQTLAAHDAGSIIVESTAIPAVDDNNWVCVRCLIGATPFWLIGTTTAPS